jgi:twitching motility protein PilT
MENQIDSLLRDAVAAGASDIHLKVGSAPVMRVEGKLRRMEGFESLKPDDTQGYAESLFTEKAASDFSARGASDFAYGRHEIGRFRVSAFRQRGSVSLVLRRVVPGSKTFEELGLPRAVEKLANKDSGLLLITGPSGSGKTTTMASIVDWINANRGVSILTIEDPIEVLHPDKSSVVVQREIGVDTPDAATAVRSALRHDTDVIVISEVDDADSIRAAVAAAETGHLVITSMRTTDPADTIHRVTSMFPETEQQVIKGQFASQMLAIISQRLVDGRDRNRVLAAEVLTNNERVQEWIMGDADQATLIDIMKESEFFGMQTFDQAMLNLVVSHAVELPNVLPYVRNIHEVRAKAMAAGIEV